MSQDNQNINYKSNLIHLIKCFDADFQWKVSLKILNSGMILKNLWKSLSNTMKVLSVFKSVIYAVHFRLFW